MNDRWWLYLQHKAFYFAKPNSLYLLKGKLPHSVYFSVYYTKLSLDRDYVGHSSLGNTMQKCMGKQEWYNIPPKFVCWKENLKVFLLQVFLSRIITRNKVLNNDKNYNAKNIRAGLHKSRKPRFQFSLDETKLKNTNM